MQRCVRVRLETSSSLPFDEFGHQKTGWASHDFTASHRRCHHSAFTLYINIREYGWGFVQHQRGKERHGRFTKNTWCGPEVLSSPFSFRSCVMPEHTCAMPWKMDGMNLGSPGIADENHVDLALEGCVFLWVNSLHCSIYRICSYQVNDNIPAELHT